MKSRTIRTLALTTVGLGGAQLGNLYTAITDDDAQDLVDAAWEAGIRYFDTAPHYGLGLSEQRLGRALAGHPRNEYVISTKVGRLLIPNPTGAARRDDHGFDVPASYRREWDFSRDGVRRSLDASLERLGLDRVDIVYAHDPDDHLEQAISDGIPALAELRDEGVIGAIGAGMNRTAPLARIITATDVDVVMCAGRYTLLDQAAMADLVPAAEARGVAIVAAGVFNSGILSTPTPGDDAHYDYATAPSELVRRAQQLADVCAAYGVSLPQAALAFPLLRHSVVSEVLGMQDRAQVMTNLADAQTPVPDALWDELRERDLLHDDGSAAIASQRSRS